MVVMSVTVLPRSKQLKQLWISSYSNSCHKSGKESTIPVLRRINIKTKTVIMSKCFDRDFKCMGVVGEE